MLVVGVDKMLHAVSFSCIRSHLGKYIVGPMVYNYIVYIVAVRNLLVFI